MAKRPTTPRAEARELATAAKPPELPRHAASSTEIDINRDPAEEHLEVDNSTVSPDEDEIRRRAYQRYLERGGADGSDFDDWLEAERELRQK
jgi:hypothetical protein